MQSPVRRSHYTSGIKRADGERDSPNRDPCPIVVMVTRRALAGDKGDNAEQYDRGQKRYPDAAEDEAHDIRAYPPGSRRSTGPAIRPRPRAMLRPTGRDEAQPGRPPCTSVDDSRCAPRQARNGRQDE